MASKSISKLTRSWPPSSSPNLLNHHLQVYVYTRSNMDSNFGRSLSSQSISPNSSDNGLQVHFHTHSLAVSKFALLWPSSAYLQTRSTTASRCFTKLTQSGPQSASLSSLDHGLHVYLQTWSSMVSKCISRLL